MKSSKLPEAERKIRRELIMSKRAAYHRIADQQIVSSDDRYPHSSTRQRARYARQIAAGKLNF